MEVTTQVYPSAKGDITLYTLTNASGAKVVLSTLGAGIVSVIVPDKKGIMSDVVLGYANPTDYFYDGPCAGKVPGRYANRIAFGHFVLDGKDYNLAINNGPNALHGGPEGFQNRIWESTQNTDGSVTFSRISPDGEEGYPGTVKVCATYNWSDDNKLSLRLHAETDSKTIINLTNHAYFNLAGENAGSVLNHKLWIDANLYLPTDDSLIPTGDMVAVKGTPMDFTLPKTIATDIKAEYPALVYGKGYDNCWVVNGWHKNQLKTVARLIDEHSGRVLEVDTTQPAVQVYTGNWLAGSPKSKSGRSYNDYDGVAIECQHMPDAPNKPQFVSTELNPGDTLEEIIIFKFKTL
jgi:aldose 1-epimerase